MTHWYNKLKNPHVVVMYADGRYFFAKQKFGEFEWRLHVEEATHFEKSTAADIAKRWPTKCVALGLNEAKETVAEWSRAA